MDPKLSLSMNNFALRFCNELGKDITTTCSPLSAELVLAMLALGCRDQSHAELMQALGVPDDDALRSSFGFLTSRLKSIKGVTLNLANRIYLKKDETLKSGFKKDVEEVFDSSLELLDFREKETSAGAVNEWVAQRTNNLIKDIAFAEMFDEKTSMVLISAIYFKGNWATPFMMSATRDDEFYVNKSNVIRVPLMFQDSVILYYGTSVKLKAKLLQMHYEGFQSSMIVVLPDQIEGLSSMLQQLAAGHDLMEDISTLKRTLVEVMIPKFKAEMTINLKDILSKLGINSIFNKDSSGFNVLSSSKQLFVSEAIQKAFIEVNEVGTEAAAACRLVMKRACLSENTQFVADHPFLYLLVAQGVPVFVGTYCGPQQHTFEVAT